MKRMSVTLQQDTADRLAAVSKQTGIPQARLIELALRKLLADQWWVPDASA